MQKDQHLAWNVKYAAGTIEARGYKGDKLALTAKRETTGAAAALAMAADRTEISADGEDVAMFAVEVRDAQGRLVPVTDNTVNFRVIGEGRLIGVGNGDPTDHASDKGSSRKAFSGLCMALVQSTKAGGKITVEASSPGLATARVTIAAKAVTLRPQVAVWERKAPAGAGITGLWRPEPDSATQIFVLRQDGNKLTGTAEGVAAGWAGGSDPAIPILEGKVDGDAVSFKAGNAAFSGKLNGDRIELVRAPNPGRPRAVPAEQTAEPRPAIGPAPDGSDPSRSPFWHPPGNVTVVLRRVQR